MAEEVTKRRCRRDYSTDFIIHCLTTVAKNNGNVRASTRELNASGYDIPRETLKQWVNGNKAEEYLRIREDIVGQTYAKEGDRFHQAVLRDLELNDKIRDKFDVALDNDKLEARDLSNALRNTTVSAATNFDKASLADGRPTEIKVTTDITSIVRSLEGQGVDVKKLGVIEGEAEEIVQSDES